MLLLLSHYNPLPLRVIGEVLKIDDIDLSKSLRYLIDTSSIIVDSYGSYQVSEPLIDAILQIFSDYKIDAKIVVQVLKQFLSEEQEFSIDHRLKMNRNLARAELRSGDFGNGLGIAMASDYINLAQRYYHERDYTNSAKFGREAVSFRPKNIEARSYLARALVRIGEYNEARLEAVEIARLGDSQEAAFINGFIERNMGNAEAALRAYQDAYDKGRRGAAISRELASCYLYLGKVNEARKHVDDAMTRDPYNKFLLDLKIQIAARQLDHVAAEDTLRILERADDRPFYLHRVSTVEYVFNSKQTAFDAINEACKLLDRPTFAMLAQLVKCAIAINDKKLASDSLSRISFLYSNHGTDIFKGLSCKLQIAYGNIDAARNIWDTLENKEKRVHKAIKIIILNRLKEQNNLLPSVNADIDRELHQLVAELGDYHEESLDLDLE